MLRLCVSVGVLVATLLGTGISAQADVTGKWIFRNVGNRFQGVITLKQTGSDVTGSWHTEIGKSEPDSEVEGRVERNSLHLRRLVASDSQTYFLLIATDGDRIDGIGFGWGIDGYTNLNMRKAGATLAPIADISGVGFST